MPTRIAVDAMGGDHAPHAVVEGAVHALQSNDDLEVLLFGPAATLEPLVADLDPDHALALSIHDAPDIVGMSEAPSSALRTKPNSSIHLGLGAHKAGAADAFVSGGNTGAVMAASLFLLGRAQGVSRPSVIGFFPTTTSYCIVLDVGTNVDCKPEHLVQFAKMGAVYARRVMDRPEPRVGLMNVGEEPGKGNEVVKATYELLREATGFDFVGNIEGRDVFHHAADVVVCDGFVGNVMLKLGESLTTVLLPLVKKEMARQDVAPAHQQVVGQVLKGVLRQFDYVEFGGAPLLGVNGTVLLAHGSSSARAFKHLIEAAVRVANQGVAASVADALAP
ncbi:MAG: phosphate acyltransferase PlsX [Bacteroidota bacterium]